MGISLHYEAGYCFMTGIFIVAFELMIEKIGYLLTSFSVNLLLKEVFCDSLFVISSNWKTFNLNVCS